MLDKKMKLIFLYFDKYLKNKIPVQKMNKTSSFFRFFGFFPKKGFNHERTLIYSTKKKKKSPHLPVTLTFMNIIILDSGVWADPEAQETEVITAAVSHQPPKIIIIIKEQKEEKNHRFIVFRRSL